MLYVYIINIFIYSGTRSVLGSVRFGYFRYKNMRTVRVFEGIGPISGISVRFFGSGYFVQAYINIVIYCK